MITDDARPLTTRPTVTRRGAEPAAGLVQPIAGGIVDDGVLRPTLQYPGGYLLGNTYGRVLSSSSD